MNKQPNEKFIDIATETLFKIRRNRFLDRSYPLKPQPMEFILEWYAGERTHDSMLWELKHYTYSNSEWHEITTAYITDHIDDDDYLEISSYVATRQDI